MKLSLKAYIIKTSIDELMVAITMSFLAGILSYNGESSMAHYIFTSAATWYCIPFSFTLGWVLTIVIPSGKLCVWFAKVCGIPENSPWADWVGNLLPNIYLTAILSFSCKMLVLLPSWTDVLNAFTSTFVTSYIVSLIVYVVSYKLTLRLGQWMDNKSKDKNISKTVPYQLDKNN